MRDQGGTNYRAEVIDQDGITVTVEVFIPAGASYEDQHEQAEHVGNIAGRLISTVHRNRHASVDATIAPF